MMRPLTRPRQTDPTGSGQRTLRVAAVFAACLLLSGPARALGRGQANGASVQKEDGRYLPANTWVRLDTVPTERFVPRDFVDCGHTAILSNPVGRRASSVMYGGDIFYFGGGGQSHPANDVELFDIGTNTWIQQLEPECLPACCAVDQKCDDACLPIAGVGTTAVTPLGRPYTEKTFQLVAYNPMRRTYNLALTSGLWEWSPSDKQWTRLTPDRPTSSDIATKMLVYDPDVGTVLYFATTQSNHTVFQFDYDTNAWVPRGPIPTEISFAQIFSAYDATAHKYLVAHGKGTYWIYDALDSSWKRLENVPADAVFRPNVDTNSMAFDPLAGSILLAKRSGTTDAVEVWSYTLPSDTWTPLPLADGPPRGPTTSYNGLVYDPVWKRFYFVDVRSIGGGGQGGTREGDVQTWAFRIDGAIGPGDADCDGHVRAADLVRMIQLLPNGPDSDCGVFDANRDGTLSAADVPLIVPGLFTAAQ